MAPETTSIMLTAARGQQMPDQVAKDDVHCAAPRHPEASMNGLDMTLRACERSTTPTVPSPAEIP